MYRLLIHLAPLKVTGGDLTDRGLQESIEACTSKPDGAAP